MFSRDDLIEETRDLWRRTPFNWDGQCCIMSVCDYVLKASGRDPAAPWRGSYSTQAGAERIWQAHGSVLALFRAGMARAGFPEAGRARGRPVIADVVGRQIAGIDLGKTVMMRVEGRGLVDLPVPVLGGWACD